MTEVPVPFHIAHAGLIEDTAARLHLALDGEGAVPPKTLEGAQLVWGHIYGYLRSSIPNPVPADLMAVAVSAGLRVTKGFADTGSMIVRRGEYNDVADFRPWTGFMLVERVILNRYRTTVR
ncbi:hypothetical protein Pve01_94910 [Planomonospora venezuelensis]|nr:hypothetical protein Pve01_94910 [Planomonospora venezuelensis]